MRTHRDTRRGSGGEGVRALGRLRGAALPGARDAERLGDVVKFHWEAVDKDGEAFGVGLNFLVVAADGRIERDYTFVVAWRAARRKTAWGLVRGALSWGSYCDR